MKYEFFIALRFLKELRGKSFISRISMITLIIVSLAVFLPMVTMSVMNGFHKSIIAKHINKDYHIQVQRDNLYDVSHLIRGIRDNPKIREDIKSIAPFYTAQGLVKNKESKYFGVIVKGSKPASYKEDTSFRDNFPIIAGGYDFKANFRIVIGDKLARLLNPSKGQYTKFIDAVNKGKGPIIYFLASVAKDFSSLDLSKRNKANYNNPKLSVFKLKVSGVFRSGYLEYDSHLAFSSLKTSQIIYNARIRVGKSQYFLLSGIGIRLHDRSRASYVQSILQSMLQGFSVVTWQNKNKHLIYAFEWEDRIMAIILFIMVFVSVIITIYINLNIIVMDKKKEIGILKSFGVKNSSIGKIFTLEAFAIGFFGSLIGSFISILFTLSLIDIIAFFERGVNLLLTMEHNYFSSSKELLLKWEFFSGSLGHLKAFIYFLDIWDLYMLVFLAIFVSLVAAYFSAKRSLKETISDSFRY